MGIHRLQVDSHHKGQWPFLWSAPEQTVKQKMASQVIWDAIALTVVIHYGCNLQSQYED